MHLLPIQQKWLHFPLIISASLTHPVTWLHFTSSIQSSHSHTQKNPTQSHNLDRNYYSSVYQYSRIHQRWRRRRLININKLWNFECNSYSSLCKVVEPISYNAEWVNKQIHQNILNETFTPHLINVVKSPKDNVDGVDKHEDVVQCCGCTLSCQHVQQRHSQVGQHATLWVNQGHSVKDTAAALLANDMSNGDRKVYGRETAFSSLSNTIIHSRVS